jgi:RNA-directed DNA polymerase
MSLEIKISKTSEILRGWMNYFMLATGKRKLEELDSFIRKRCRIVAWVQWKRIRTKYKMLRRLGVSHDKSYQWANTSKGATRVALSPILSTTLTTSILSGKGLYSLVTNYENKKEIQQTLF